MTKQVAWTGTPSRYIQLGDGSVELDYEHENQRDIPFWYANKPGAIRVVGPREGLSQEYRFGGGAGPQSFILEMSDEDATVLLNHPSLAENFKDVTHDPGFFERFYRPLDEILHDTGGA